MLIGTVVSFPGQHPDFPELARSPSDCGGWSARAVRRPRTGGTKGQDSRALPIPACVALNPALRTSVSSEPATLRS